MPGPSRRPAERGGPSERRAGAQRQRRTRRPAPKRLARRVSWPRRLGFATALVLLVGGSIAFAGGALNGRGTATPADATPPPPPALTLLAPAETITRSARVDLTAIRPPGMRQDQSYQVLVYVNGERLRERALPDGDQFVLAGIPLEQGTNAIRASLSGAGGEGERSTAVSITRDDVAPVIRVNQPPSGGKVYGTDVTLLGRTEPGATITITDLGANVDLHTAIQGDGQFSADLTLELGDNRFLLRSVDAAGNRASTRITINRATSSASLALTINPDEIGAADLPQRVTMTAFVRDEHGRAVEGASVIFSVSPPDRETTTYRVMTTNGRARWSDLVIDPGDSRGTWLVTALATLSSGEELRQDGSFRLE